MTNSLTSFKSLLKVTSSLRSTVTAVFKIATCTSHFLLSPFLPFPALPFPPWSLWVYSMLCNLVINYVTAYCLLPTHNASSLRAGIIILFTNVFKTPSTGPDICYILSKYLLINEEGICSLQTFSSVEISRNLSRFRWARAQGWWQRRADKAFWALVGSPVCSAGDRQSLAEPSLHLCKSEGAYHSLTLHVDAFWNVPRTGRLWQMPFCLTHADCLKWGNICQKLNAVLGTF